MTISSSLGTPTSAPQTIKCVRCHLQKPAREMVLFTVPSDDRPSKICQRCMQELSEQTPVKREQCDEDTRCFCCLAGTALLFFAGVISLFYLTVRDS